MINIPALSKGKLLEVYNETITTPVIVQILNLKPLPGKDRYRCEVSDGISKINAIFASQFNTEISSGTISSNSVLSLNKYTPTPSKTSKILVIVQATVVHPPLPEVIGNPIFIEASSTPSPPMNQPNMIPRPPNPYPPQNVNQPRPTFNQPPQMNNTYNRPPQQQPYNQMTVGGAYNQPMPNIPPTHIPIRPDVVSGNFMKIAMLNPYSSTWTIKGRISKKAPIKTYTNSKGPGKLFNIEIIVNYSLTTQDEDGSEIKGTFFNDEVERWFDVLSEGMVYAISGGNLRPAKREFSSVNCNYEIIFNNKSYFTPLQEDGNIKSIIYNLVKISDIANIPDGKSVDVLGVVYSNQPSATIPTKKGEMVKKDMELVDSSGYRIRLTLWGEDASNNDNIPDDSIIVAKGCKIGNFNGKSLSLLRDGVMLINPNINEAIELRRWYDGVGKTSTFTSFGMSSGDGTERKRHNLIEITKDKIEETLNSKDVSFIDTKATITKIPHEKDLWYPSCPNMLADTGKQCRKKLTEDLERNWSCERCGQSFPRPDYRYIANFQIKDHTGNVFASCFDDEARIVFHQPAEQLLTARDSPDYEDILFECCFQEYNMTIKSNYNIDQGEKKYRRTVAKIEPIEFVKVYKIE